MNPSSETLRIALIAGTLGRGGTEKQLWYLTRALRAAGSEVVVCSLTRGEYYESELRRIGVDPCWVGRHSTPPARLIDLVRKLWTFRPHVIQSMHSFTNLYASMGARALGAISLGALRCDLQLSAEDNGHWTKWLLRTPDAVVVNSLKVYEQLLEANAVAPERVQYAPNSIDATLYAGFERERNGSIAIFVGRLVASKRLDCFLRALAIARGRMPDFQGVVVGAGPELEPMRLLAAGLGLDEQAVRFLGARDDLPALLAKASMLVVCSESEGSPNVILEAMAAGLPVITTPAGDADLIVKHGESGYVVPFDDPNATAEWMLTLAGSPELRRAFEEAGTRIIERDYSAGNMAAQFLSIYRAVARRRPSRRTQRVLACLPPATVAGVPDA